MKKCLAILAIVFLAALIGVVAAQETATITKTGKVGWNPVTARIDGSECEVDHYVIAVSAVNEDLAAGGSPLATIDADCTAEACQSRIDDLVEVVSAPVVKFWVRAVDTSGVQGLWSEPLELTITKAPPEKPTGFKVVTTVTTVTTTTTTTTVTE